RSELWCSCCKPWRDCSMCEEFTVVLTGVKTKLTEIHNFTKERCMSGIPNNGNKLSLSEKFSRLAVRLKDPEWRRYGRLLLAGKALGVALVLLVIVVITGVFFGRVYAADAELKAAAI